MRICRYCCEPQPVITILCYYRVGGVIIEKSKVNTVTLTDRAPEPNASARARVEHSRHQNAYLIEILANTTLRPDKVTARTRYYVGTAIRSTKCGRTRTGTHGHLTRDARHFGLSRASPHVTPLGRDGYWKCPALAPDAPAVILLCLPTVAKAAASRAVAYTEQSGAIRTAIRLMTLDGHSECRTDRRHVSMASVRLRSTPLSAENLRCEFTPTCSLRRPCHQQTLLLPDLASPSPP